MKRCGHCGADFDDRIEFCFNDGTPLETAIVTSVPGAPPKRSQSSRFSNALAGIDAPEANSLAFDAPDTSPDVFSEPAEPPVQGSGFSQPENTDSLDVPDMDAGAPIFMKGKASSNDDVYITDITDITDLDLDAETEKILPKGSEPASGGGDDFGDDFGFMQDTGELQVESDDLFFDDTPAKVSRPNKLPMMLAAAAVLVALGASVSMLSDSDESGDDIQLTELTQTENYMAEVARAEDEEPEAMIGSTGEGIEEPASPPAVQEMLEEAAPIEVEDEFAEAELQAPVVLQEREVSSATVRPVDEPTMPMSLNRPQPATELPATTVQDSPEPQEEPSTPVEPAPVATPAVASPWGSVPTGPTNTATASTSRIRVQSTPSGAQVFVDGASQGVTPADFNLSRGAHQIAIEKSGYVRYTENVSVQHDSQMIRANLEAVAIENFDVVVSFYGASGWRVFESNSPVCTVPCSQQMSTGTHHFRVVNESESWVVTRDIQGQYAGASVGVNLQQD